VRRAPAGDEGDRSWQQTVVAEARPGSARPLTVDVLRAYQELRLVEVIRVIAPACAAGMRVPVFGRCQTIDAGVGTIDARGPGWIDSRYPLDPVLAELANAGFGPEVIVALFNGNVPLDRLGSALRVLFPGYLPDYDDEAIGVRLAQRWRCSLPCCQPRRRRLSLRFSRSALVAGPTREPQGPSGPVHAVEEPWVGRQPGPLPLDRSPAHAVGPGTCWRPGVPVGRPPGVPARRDPAPAAQCCSGRWPVATQHSRRHCRQCSGCSWSRRHRLRHARRTRRPGCPTRRR